MEPTDGASEEEHPVPAPFKDLLPCGDTASKTPGDERRGSQTEHHAQWKWQKAKEGAAQ